MTDSPSLQGLNPEQIEAVLHASGPLLVLAGAGSGKTRVITHRIARLVEAGADPRGIVAVTFTNKAAEEMRGRAQRLLGGGVPVGFIGTFHSWSLRFLRRHAAAAGISPRFSIADSADQLSLVKEAMSELRSLRDAAARGGGARPDIAGEELPRLCREIRGSVGRFRRRAGRQGLPSLRAQARRRWRARFRRSRSYGRCGSSRSREDVLASERRRTRHLLIDEYQDTNTSQDALVKLLGAGTESLCAVGDEDQAIYRWRGAEVEHILRFDQDFPAARIVALERNYRSTGKILESASALVSHNRRRRPKRLRAERGGGARVRLWRFDEDRSEAEAVARDLAGVRPRSRGGRHPLSHERPVPELRRRARAAPDSLHRRRRHEVLRASRGQGRARVPAPRRPARGRSRLPAGRQRARARTRRSATLERIAEASRSTGRSWWEVSGEPLPGLTERARVGLDRFRGLIADLRREGRLLVAVRPPRAPARRERVRGALRGLGRAGRRRPPREPAGASLLRPGVRAAQRGGRDGRGVPRRRLARDGRRRRASLAAAP